MGDNGLLMRMQSRGVHQELDLIWLRKTGISLSARVFVRVRAAIQSPVTRSSVEVGWSYQRLGVQTIWQAQVVVPGSIKECLSIHFRVVGKEIFGGRKLVLVLHPSGLVLTFEH